MKRSRIILLAAVSVAFSCAKSEIPTYQLEDSAVAFTQLNNSFSLRGMAEPEKLLTVNITLIGQVSQEDRPFAYTIEEHGAVLGTDYTIESAKVPAGALKGELVLRVKKLPEGIPSRRITVTLKENEYLKEGYKGLLTADLAWTETYERPQEGVWRYWYTYLSHSYSRNFHKLLVDLYGDDMEKYTCSRSYVTQDPSLIYQLPTWWFARSAELKEIIRKHDLANPTDPYRHSQDYEQYISYLQGVGNGQGLQEGQTPPTILETLVNF